MRTLVVALLSACALAACSKKAAAPPAGASDAGPRGDGAVVPGDATPSDAASAAGDGGVVSCYTEGNPSQSCTLPVHCCFSNYSSQHDGMCTTGACLYGTIECDGPEDCAAGAHCCSHALFASDGSVMGYSLACQFAACGAAPANYELCHTAGPPCSNGGTCVTAYGNDNDLPRTLDICR